MPRFLTATVPGRKGKKGAVAKAIFGFRNPAVAFATDNHETISPQ